MAGPRDIVLCLDGTNNEVAEPATNVLRFYRALDHKSDRIRAFYDPGVGTFSVRPSLTSVARDAQRVAGLAFGYGFRQNVAEAYTFLVEHYQKGDRIWITGFSRGAYAARVVAALVKAYGVARPGTEHLIPYMLRGLEMPMTPDDHREVNQLRKVAGGRRGTPVHFLGLWDTVSSVAWNFDPFSCCYVSKNDAVTHVRHAVSLDERRAFFRTNLFTPTGEQDVKEVWFSGVHSDVGGGYPDASLSKIALEWIMVEARDAGLRFDPKAARRILSGKTPIERPSPLGLVHRSLGGAWWIGEVYPKRPWIAEKDRREFRVNRAAHRRVPDDAVIHDSVIERAAAGRPVRSDLDLTTHPREPVRTFDDAVPRERVPADPAVQPATWSRRIEAAVAAYALVGVVLVAASLAAASGRAVVASLTTLVAWPVTLMTSPRAAFLGLAWPIVIWLVGKAVDAPLAARRDAVDGRWLHLRPWYSPTALRGQLDQLGDGLANYRRALLNDLPFVLVYVGVYAVLWRAADASVALSESWALKALVGGAVADLVEDAALLQAIAVTRRRERVSDGLALLAAGATTTKMALLATAAVALFVHAVGG